jgi:hypothetical protein
VSQSCFVSQSCSAQSDVKPDGGFNNRALST